MERHILRLNVFPEREMNKNYKGPAFGYENHLNPPLPLIKWGKRNVLREIVL